MIHAMPDHRHREGAARAPIWRPVIEGGGIAARRGALATTNEPLGIQRHGVPISVSPSEAAMLGLLVHFAIMTVMVSVFVVSAWRLPFFAAHPVIAGIAYGFLLYLVMYWIVLPLRWPGNFPSLKPQAVASALFAHIVCVGIPMGLITARGLGRGASAVTATA